jgi:hypothetical protein
VRYAAAQGRRYYIIRPDGSVQFTEKIVQRKDVKDTPNVVPVECQTWRQQWGNSMTNEEQARREGLAAVIKWNDERGNGTDIFKLLKGE